MAEISVAEFTRVGNLSPVSPHAAHFDLSEHMDIYELLKLVNNVPSPDRCLLHCQTQPTPNHVQIHYFLTSGNFCSMQREF